MNNITVTKPAYRSWKLWATLTVFKAGAFITFGLMTARGVEMGLAWGTMQYHTLRDKALALVTIETVRTEIREPNELELGEIIAQVSHEQGFDPIIMEVLTHMESGGGKFLYRFEPDKFADLQRSAKFKGRSTDELRMTASSHGPFHVMGYSAEAYCGLPWHRLYDTGTGARCAAKILGRLWQDTKSISDPGDRLREVFKRWNGTGDRAEGYADKAMGMVAKRLYKQIAAK